MLSRMSTRDQPHPTKPAWQPPLTPPLSPAFGWEQGLGRLSHPLPNPTQLHPTPTKARRSPTVVGGQLGLALAGAGRGWGGTYERATEAVQARGIGLLALLPEFPPRPTPPPASSCTRSLDVPFFKGIQKAGAGSRRRGVGLGAHHSGGLRRSGVFPASTCALGSCRAGRHVRGKALTNNPIFDDYDSQEPCHSKDTQNKDAIRLFERINLRKLFCKNILW